MKANKQRRNCRGGVAAHPYLLPVPSQKTVKGEFS